MWKTDEGEGEYRLGSDTKVLRFGEQKGLETPVVQTVNTECSIF
jgi:hypothetical protein